MGEMERERRGRLCSPARKHKELNLNFKQLINAVQYAMHMLFVNVYLNLTSVRACLCSVCVFYYVSVFVNVCILF